MDRLAETLEALVGPGRLPSASLCVWVDGAEVFHHTVGLARVQPARPAEVDQVYDLASVTKILATVPVVSHQIAHGLLDLDAPVRDVLPRVHPDITARMLLSHSSGYPAWAPLYEVPEDPWGSPGARRAILDAARDTPLQTPPGTAHRYSDLGYLVLCDLLETLAACRLDDALPAGPLRWDGAGAAATEDCPIRGRVIEGALHDLNGFAMGGVSTHAGLFGTAHEVATVADQLRVTRDADTPLGRAVQTLAGTRGPGSHRLGFDGISDGYTSTGQHFPPDSIGHLGYTGTSVWIVPSRRTTVAFLTNRIHPSDDTTSIRAARPRIHDEVARALGWVGR